jgi:lipopolysaccharide transport system ATP-binding protein
VTRPLLSLKGVSKRYPPTVHTGERLRAFWQLLWHGSAQGGAEVLQDIDFEIYPGESLAVIGSNGAGKSTLLKVITGVLAPTEGEVEQRGRIAALLELGAGFDPEYTGLDNLRMNAAFLGLSRKEVDERLDDILAFADIGESINEPVKHYSSGMVVRLGFAVVASVRPDLLITDEVLAVGDESFQKKCIRWIEGYLAEGGTMLMVSHNMYQVQKLCRHALWLEGGRVASYGDVFDVTQSYLAWHERKGAQETMGSGSRNSNAPYRITHLHIADRNMPNPSLATGDSLKVRVEMTAPDGRSPVVLIGIVRADGTPVYGVATDQESVEPVPDGRGNWHVTLGFTELPLLPGGYALRAHAMDPEGLRIHDTVEESFSVTGRSRELGLVRLSHEWLEE